MRGMLTLTSCLLGDSNTKLSGLAMRNMNDSTLNCEPRLSTEKKSTPNTRANSLVKHQEGYSSRSAENARVLGDHFSGIHNFQDHGCASSEVSQ